MGGVRARSRPCTDRGPRAHGTGQTSQYRKRCSRGTSHWSNRNGFKKRVRLKSQPTQEPAQADSASGSPCPQSTSNGHAGSANPRGDAGCAARNPPGGRDESADSTDGGGANENRSGHAGQGTATSRGSADHIRPWSSRLPCRQHEAVTADAQRRSDRDPAGEPKRPLILSSTHR